jgi:hypothetical protein
MAESDAAADGKLKVFLSYSRKDARAFEPAKGDSRY